MSLDDYSISTACLPGALDDKLELVARAGFRRIELSAKEIMTHPAGLDGAARALRAHGLEITALHSIHEFEGMPDSAREYRVEIAKSIIALARRIGARMVIVAASSSPQAAADHDRLVRDLRVLSALATPGGVRLGFKSTPWARWTNTQDSAYRLVEAVDRANFGLAVDGYHILATGDSLAALSHLPARRIFHVHLSDWASDYLSNIEDILDVARHQRLFPGGGIHGPVLAKLAGELRAGGYAGLFGLDPLNDDYLARPTAEVVALAGESARWLDAHLDA